MKTAIQAFTAAAVVIALAAADERRTFDVLDEAGRRVGTVRLPADRRFEGFGSRSVYASRVDELDFVWLERYELPAL